MSNPISKKGENNFRQKNRNTSAFLVLGIIQLIYLLSSIFLGFLSGCVGGNDPLFYPFNRNAKVKGRLVLFLTGIGNAIYIAMNKRINLENKVHSKVMKSAIPLGSWGISNFLLYNLGYNLSQPFWDNVSTLYGVYNRRKKHE